MVNIIEIFPMYVGVPNQCAELLGFCFVSSPVIPPLITGFYFSEQMAISVHLKHSNDPLKLRKKQKQKFVFSPL